MSMTSSIKIRGEERRGKASIDPQLAKIISFIQLKIRECLMTTWIWSKKKLQLMLSRRKPLTLDKSKKKQKTRDSWMTQCPKLRYWNPRMTLTLLKRVAITNYLQASSPVPLQTQVKSRCLKLSVTQTINPIATTYRK